MPWVPSIASGFDPLAQQQQFYAGLNTDVLRGNANAIAEANAQRNQYMFALAGLRQRAAEQQQQIQQNAVANAVSGYQFNRQMALEQQKADQAAALKQEQLTLGEQADVTAQTQRKSELTDAENLQAASDLASKGKYASVEELQAAIPNGTPQQVKDLWETNRVARTAVTRQTDISTALAAQLNERASLGSQLGKGAPKTDQPIGVQWWNPMSDIAGAGAALDRAFFPPTPINTNWFDNLKTRAAALDTQLSKLGLQFNDTSQSVVTPAKTSLEDFGVSYNPKTQRYETISPESVSTASPAWVGAARATTPTSSPPPAAVAYLKAHPELSKEFDEKYGQGAAEGAMNQ